MVSYYPTLFECGMIGIQSSSVGGGEGSGDGMRRVIDLQPMFKVLK